MGQFGSGGGRSQLQTLAWTPQLIDRHHKNTCRSWAVYSTLIYSFKYFSFYILIKQKRPNRFFPSTHFNKTSFQAAASYAKIQPGNAGSLIARATPAVVLQLSVDLLFKYNPACELNADRFKKKTVKRKKNSLTILKWVRVITYKLFALLKCAKPKQIKCNREYDSRRVKVISTELEKNWRFLQAICMALLTRIDGKWCKKGRNVPSVPSEIVTRC